MQIFMKSKRLQGYVFSSREEFKKDVAENAGLFFGDKSVYVDTGREAAVHGSEPFLPHGFLFDFSGKDKPRLYLVQMDISINDYFISLLPEVTRHLITLKDNKKKARLAEALTGILMERPETVSRLKKLSRSKDMLSLVKSFLEDCGEVLLIIDGRESDIREITAIYSDTWEKSVRSHTLMKFSSGRDFVYIVNPEFKGGEAEPEVKNESPMAENDEAEEISGVDIEEEAFEDLETREDLADEEYSEEAEKEMEMIPVEVDVEPEMLDPDEEIIDEAEPSEIIGMEEESLPETEELPLSLEEEEDISMMEPEEEDIPDRTEEDFEMEMEMDMVEVPAEERKPSRSSKAALEKSLEGIKASRKKPDHPSPKTKAKEAPLVEEVMEMQIDLDEPVSDMDDMTAEIMDAQESPEMELAMETREIEEEDLEIPESASYSDEVTEEELEMEIMDEPEPAKGDIDGLMRIEDVEKSMPEPEPEIDIDAMIEEEIVEPEPEPEPEEDLELKWRFYSPAQLSHSETVRKLISPVLDGIMVRTKGNKTGLVLPLGKDVFLHGLKYALSYGDVMAPFLGKRRDEERMKEILEAGGQLLLEGLMLLGSEDQSKVVINNNINLPPDTVDAILKKIVLPGVLRGALFSQEVTDLNVKYSETPDYFIKFFSMFDPEATALKERFFLP